jgi:hypothetical protein
MPYSRLLLLILCVKKKRKWDFIIEFVKVTCLTIGNCCLKNIQKYLSNRFNTGKNLQTKAKKESYLTQGLRLDKY